ncbi:hypothetical protein EPUS_08422 [Endocarpon pusillum Z07020]|uniref:Uncharacterized protein n=1 Tax=Endocarpon pusillum (strain Z07020 / HMAS-L-300199) TaxID=1263415 RepID=U1GIR4_ENDPU|nr:uncharacterized protein EPUS_08422 [Endocarpon pusillum Z07020]ERF72028.1 hypothetical protein EPUS_08422 [Endocarpon pusillum Z07020]
MPEPMFQSPTASNPLISAPLLLRTYQDQEGECSRWSMSAASEDSDDESARPSFWPAMLPTIPPRSPLRSRLNRPNIPPALTPRFNTATAEPDLGYYFDPGLPTPTTATTTTSSPPSVRCLTTEPSASPASAPACHTTYASADPSFPQWLAATIGQQRHLHSRRLAAATSSATRFTERDHLASPVPPEVHAYKTSHQSKAQRHARSESSYDYTDYLEQTSSPALPPPSSLSLCNSSGWSCIARRTSRTSRTP